MKKFFVFAALILISATVVFAQSWTSVPAPVVDPGPPTADEIFNNRFNYYGMSTSGLGFGNASPQNTSTAGRFRSAADNYIRPDSFAGVSFEKFYAMASFANAGKANLGFATKIGTLYLAAAYAGSFWTGYSTFPYQEVKEEHWGANTSDPNGSEKTVPGYDFNHTDPFNGKKTDNRVGLLIGLPSANMGFQVSYTSTDHEWKTFKDIDAKASITPPPASGPTTTNIQLKKYTAERGSYSPRIGWAMTKGLMDKGIQPYAIVDLNFVRGSIKAISANDKDEAVIVLSSENHFDPKLTIGSGDFTIYKNDSNFSFTAGLDYALQLKFYSNEYNYTDASDSANSKIKINKVKGLETSTGYEELSWNGHIIQPQLAGAWRSDNLGLRVRLFLPITLAGGSSTPMKIKTTWNATTNDWVQDNSGELEQTGAKESTFVVGFAPRLQLGAQWKIVEKLTLNAGGQIDLNLVNRATIKTAEFTDEKTLDTNTNLPAPTKYDATKRVEERYLSTTNSLRAGVTFTPTENLSFEVSTGIGDGSFNVFGTGPGSLTAFGGFLVGLKF